MAFDSRDLEVRILADASQFSSTMRSVADQTGAGTANFTKMAGAVATGNAIFAVAEESVHKVGEAIKDSVSQANAQDLAVARLTAGIQNVASATDKHVGALINQAQALQETTRFSDDQIISAQGILTTFQLNQRAIEQLTPRLIDMSEGLAKASGEMPDLEGNAMLVAKALGGEDTTGLALSLRRVGVMLTDNQMKTLQYGDFQQRLAAITQVLDDNFKGLGESAGNTAAGQMDKFHHSMDDVAKGVGDLVNGFSPVLGVIGQFLQQNQSMVVSAMATAIGVGILGAAFLGIAKIIPLLTVELSPLVGIFLLVGALAGVFLYDAFNRLQTQFKNSTQAAQAAGDTLGGAIPQGASKAAQATKDLAEQLADLDDQIAKSDRDFKQQMADLVKTDQDKVANLKDQLATENSDFTDAQAQKKDSFDQTSADMIQSHQDKVDAINKQIDQEVSKGERADQAKLADLRAQLTKENSDYDTHYAQLQTKYTTDVQKAQEAHDKKTKDLQTQLDTETALLQKHNADIAGLRASDQKDEFDKLIQSHNDQMTEFAKQRDKIIKNAQDTTVGIGAAFANLPNMIDPHTLDGLGAQMGQSFGQYLKNAALGALKDIGKDITNVIGNVGPGNALSKVNASNAAQTVANMLQTLFGPVPHFAGGVSNFSGGMALVGEQGPELVSLPQGSSVLPAKQTQSAMSNSSLALTVNVGMYAGEPGEIRGIATRIYQELQRIAKANGSSTNLPNIGVRPL